MADGEKLDDEFHELARSIEHYVDGERWRPARARLRAWLGKFRELERARELKRNRNRHARALVEMLRRGWLTAPFDGMPREGRLARFVREHASGLNVDGAFDASRERAEERAVSRESDRARGGGKAESNASMMTSSDFLSSASEGDRVGAVAEDDVTALLDRALRAAAGRVRGVEGETRAREGLNEQSTSVPSGAKAMGSRGGSSGDVAALRALVDELRAKLERCEAKAVRQEGKIAALKGELENERKARKIELMSVRARHKREMNELLANVTVGKTPQSSGKRSTARDDSISSPARASDASAGAADGDFNSFITTFVSETERLRERLAHGNLAHGKN